MLPFESSGLPAFDAYRGCGKVVVACGLNAPRVNEFPDCALAVRALTAAGPSWPALHAVGEERFAAALTEVLRPLHVEGVGRSYQV